MTRITPAEVREFGARLAEDGVYLMAATMRRLAKQMEADEERMKGRVLVSVDTRQRPRDKRYIVSLRFWDERAEGDTPEEAVANLQAAIDKEERTDG